MSRVTLTLFNVKLNVKKCNIYIQIAAYVMNSDHKITQWNTCNYIVLYHSNFINIYRKISPKAGKLVQCLPNPILTKHSGSEPSGIKFK